MKAGRLRDTTALAMLVSPSIVQVTMRQEREAGQLTTGAHGVNAPDMTYLDAARVLIAHIVESNPGRRAPKHVETFGSLPRSNPGDDPGSDAFDLERLVPTAKIDTFEKTLATLIQVFAECRDEPGFIEHGRTFRNGPFQMPLCRVEIFEEDASAMIRVPGFEYSFSAPHVSANEYDPSTEDERFRLGRQAISFVSQEVIRRIADGFAESSDG